MEFAALSTTTGRAVPFNPIIKRFLNDLCVHGVVAREKASCLTKRLELYAGGTIFC